MMYLITNKPLNRGRTILLTYNNMTNVYTSMLYIPIILFIWYGKSGNVWRHRHLYPKWAVNCDVYNIIAYATHPEKLIDLEVDVMKIWNYYYLRVRTVFNGKN